jgi:acyl-CoA synthetase (AMP-forming)/AMP-acid ligase II
MKKTMEQMPLLFGELPAWAAERWPLAKAVTFEGTVTTFAQLKSQVDQAARAMLSRGIRKGDSVGLWITNCPEFMVAFYAASMIGAVVVPLNTRYRADDIRFVIGHAECKLLIAIERSGPVDYLDMLKSAIPGLGDDRYEGSSAYPKLCDVVIITSEPVRNGLSWVRFLEDAVCVSRVDLDAAIKSVQKSDPALIIFTSGTTGNPKGVLHDHSNLRAVIERARAWPLVAGDSVLNFLPMFHVYGLSEMVMGSLVMGIHQVAMSAFEPVQALQLIERERVSGLHGFEIHYASMLRAQETLKADLGSLKFGTLPTGTENSTAVAEVVQDRMCPTVTGFGMSETWCWVCFTALDDTREQRCVTSGRPMERIEVKVVDSETGEDLPPDTVGEIVCRGYNMMRGYFRDPEATAKVMDREGWFRTGDQGVLRADGFLRYTGRYKEMLKVGGENVSPAAVEQELQRLVPSIQEVAVVPYPDESLGEVPVAYVVARQGMTCTLEDVQSRCKGRIASFKIPRHVLAVASLPTTPSGKVQRTLLKQRAIADLAPHR